MNKKYILFIFLISTIGLAVAADPNPSAYCTLSSSNGLLDSILRDYYTSSSKWQTILLPTAIKMYWFWFTAELLYQITFKKVLANDMQKLWYFLTIRVFTGYMFANIFVDPAFYSGVISYFVNLGGQAGNFNINPNSGNPFTALSPSGIMNVGTCLLDTMQAFIAKNFVPHPIDSIIFALPMIGCVILVYILSALMALTLIMTALEAYIVLNGGVILLGFAGSSWTQGFWNKYLSYVGGLAIRLFVMCLILGLMKDNLLSQFTQLMTISTLTDMAIGLGILIKVLISMFIYAFLVMKIPQTAGAMLTGSVSAGMGDVIQGAAMMLAGAGLAKGLAKMGINMAGGSGGGGENSAKEKFKDSLRGPGGGGLPSGGSKGGSTGATKTDSQTAKSAMSPKDKANAMADLCGVSTEDKSGGGSNSSSGDSGTSGGSDSSGSGGSSEGGSGSSSSSSGSGDSGASSGSSTSSGSSNSSGNGSSSSGSGSSSSNSTPSGGMSGNGGGSSGNKPAGKSATKDEDTQKSKNAAIIKDMIKNKDSLIRSAKQMANNSHAGAAEINANPHKHD